MYFVVYRFKFVVRRGIFVAFHCSNDPCTLCAKAFEILFGHFGLTKIKDLTKTTISFYEHTACVHKRRRIFRLRPECYRNFLGLFAPR
jgi:hypothetical protein